MSDPQIPNSSNSNMDKNSSPKLSNKLENTAFYIFFTAVILAPLAFLPFSYIAFDIVNDTLKTIVIALGVLIPTILYGIISHRERTLVLPPKSIIWPSLVVAVSLLVSSFNSFNLSRSLFGQGFEVNTASFILTLFVAGFITFTLVRRKQERASLIYIGLMVSFLIIALLHGLRFIFGPQFLSLGILKNLTTTIFGSWFDLAIYAGVIVLISLSALIFLPLSNRFKMIYRVTLVVSLISAFIVNSFFVWVSLCVVGLLMTVYLYKYPANKTSMEMSGMFSRIAWLPLAIALIAGISLISYDGKQISTPVIKKLNAEFNTLVLPWQLSLDVDTGVIKDRLLFGVGPNHFNQAFLAYKPLVINQTDAWNAEFNYGFSLLATFIATQGLLGIVSWLLLLIFIGILFTKVLKNPSSDQHEKFIAVSSVFTATFIWIMTIFTVPAHVIMFFAFIITAISISSGVKQGHLIPVRLSSGNSGLSSKLLSPAILALAVLGVLWTTNYVKDALALAYFGSGVKQLQVKNDALVADNSFKKAQSLNNSDAFLRARAEAGIVQINKLVANVDKDASASTTEALVADITKIINLSNAYAQAAIKFNPSNYYNYLSQARVAELASRINIPGAYDNALSAYTESIRYNPLNPSLYFALAQLQVSQNKLDDAIRTLGAAIQVKSNYLDAVFLLSQISAAQGNVKDAIIAAQVANQINPKNAVVLFQLGLLHFNNKDYVNSANALEKAVEIQPDYANAKYFLGLAYVRINKISDALKQFAELAISNPDNEEVKFILSNLQQGKSPFIDAQPPITPTPEKRPSLPIKEKKK